jgi:predicted dehydrogenase
MKKIKWGILGAGVIANKFCDSLLLSEKSEIFSVASQTIPLNKERLESFKKKFELKQENYFHSYYDLINLKDNDIIYIATTNINHSFYSRIIAKNKKNILVEKPAALNSLDFKNDIKIVSESNIFFLEALMYLHHPQTKMILDIIRSNEIGRIKNINFFIGFDMRRRVFKYFKKKIDFNSSRLTDPNLGGGALNDFACYGLTYAMLIAGVQNNSYFSIPTKLIAKGHVGITGVDENSMANLEFDNGIKANLLVSINKKQDNKLKIIGEKGAIIIPRPIVPHSKDFSFEIKKGFFNNKLYKNRTEKDVYGYEIEYVENCILGNISKQDINEKQMLTLKYLECLDSWKRQVYVKN